MGKLIGRKAETIESIQKRRNMAVELFKSGYTLEEISAETGYAIDSIRQVLRAKCPEEYRLGVTETITTKELTLAEDPRKITAFPLDGKKYVDITDMIAGR